MLSQARAATGAQRQVPVTLNQADRLALFHGPDRWRKRPVTFGLRIQGAPDPVVLEQALTCTARRHSALRTCFPYPPSAGHALCLDPQEISWRLAPEDLSRMTIAERPAAEESAIVALIQGFDPASPPLFRGCLLKLSDDTWLLGLAIDHLIFDGSSIPIFLRDFSYVYNYLLPGRSPADLAGEVSDFSRFCAAEQEWLGSPAAGRALRYWQPVWDGMGPSPSSIAPAMEPGTRETSGLVWCRELPGPAVTQTRRSFPGGHLSRFALAAGCVITAIRDVTGLTDCGVLYLNSRRFGAGGGELVGCLVNRMLLRIDTAGAAGLREVSGLARNAILDSMEHQMMPFEFLMQSFSPEQAGRMPQNPHVQVNVDSDPEPPALDGLKTALAWPVAGDAFREDPRIFVELQNAGPDSVILQCGYQAGLFQPELIDEFMGHVAFLLTSGGG
jgi:hypothetical protein